MKAFPSAVMTEEAINGNLSSDDFGMDLRDYFAAKAMQSLLICQCYIAIEGAKNGSQLSAEDYFTDISKDTYSFADQMIGAR